MGILKDIQKVGAVTRSPATVERRLIKATEELGELAEAILSATSKSGAKGKTWMDIIEEAVDLSVMGIDIALTKPPGSEQISDDAWRDVVTKIFALKLKKWVTQVEEERTLIPVSELPCTPAEDCATREYVENPSLDTNFEAVAEEVHKLCNPGCGKQWGLHTCGEGFLCGDCQEAEESNAGLHK